MYNSDVWLTGFSGKEIVLFILILYFYNLIYNKFAYKCFCLESAQQSNNTKQHSSFV